jgi:hypothetical protein
VVGERIHLNLETKTGRISDPLGDQTPIAQEWRKFLADLPFRVERLHGNSLGIAQKDQVFDLNIEDGSLVDTWHYWMSRFVEGSPAVQQRFAILLQGSLSPSDDLARGGRVLINKATMAGSIIDSRKFRDGPILSPPNPISDARVREFEGLIATGI